MFSPKLSNITHVKLAVFFILFIFLAGIGKCAAEATTVKNAAKSASKQPDASSVSPEIEKKLKEILKNQEQILANQAVMLQKFDAVMEELRIVKVRATLRGGS